MNEEENIKIKAFKYPRQIIQIFTRTNYNLPGTDLPEESLYCLCNDGTIWKWVVDMNIRRRRWTRSDIDQIPQD